MPFFQTLSRFVLGVHNPTSSGYTEFLWRAAWILVSIIIITYASYLYFGSVNAAYFGEPEPIAILDILKKDGEHHLSGYVPVPSPCHGLTVTPKEIDETHYLLEFTTWQEPSRSCEPLGESRAFSTIVFAPSTGITFSAAVDEKELPIRITKRF